MKATPSMIRVIDTETGIEYESLKQASKALFVAPSTFPEDDVIDAKDHADMPEDVLESLGFFEKGDQQTTLSIVGKQWCDEGQEPGMYLTIVGMDRHV